MLKAHRHVNILPYRRLAWDNKARGASVLFLPAPSQHNLGWVESQRKGEAVANGEKGRSAVCHQSENLSFDACLNLGQITVCLMLFVPL